MKNEMLDFLNSQNIAKLQRNPENEGGTYYYRFFFLRKALKQLKKFSQRTARNRRSCACGLLEVTEDNISRLFIFSFSVFFCLWVFLRPVIATNADKAKEQYLRMTENGMVWSWGRGFMLEKYILSISCEDSSVNFRIQIGGIIKPKQKTEKQTEHRQGSQLR